MDKAYAYDYDLCRNQEPYLFSHTVEEYNDDEIVSEKKRKRILPIYLLVILFFLASAIGALPFIPLFEITKVHYSLPPGVTVVPSQAIDVAKSLIGVSLFSKQVRAIRSDLLAHGMIDEVRIRRKLPSELVVHLSITIPRVYVAAISDNQVVTSLYSAQHDSLETIGLTDYETYRQQVVVLELSESYVQYIKTYGFDDGFTHALALSEHMSKEEGELFSSIQRIRYIHMPTQQFGNMILYMPSYNSQLWIREHISYDQLQTAMKLIELKHTHDQSRNIALNGQLRYDLHGHSLVSRHQ